MKKQIQIVYNIEKQNKKVSSRQINEADLIALSEIKQALIKSNPKTDSSSVYKSVINGFKLLCPLNLKAAISIKCGHVDSRTYHKATRTIVYDDQPKLNETDDPDIFFYNLAKLTYISYEALNDQPFKQFTERYWSTTLESLDNVIESLKIRQMIHGGITATDMDMGRGVKNEI